MSGERIKLLSFALLGNAFFSFLLGVVIVKWNRPVVAWLGLPDSISLFTLGIVLILFGCILVWIVLRMDVLLPVVPVVIYANIGWVICSAVLTSTGFFGALGIPVAGLIAEMALLFALFQYFGLRKIRNPLPVWRFSLITAVLLVSFGLLVMGASRERLMDLRTRSLKEANPDQALEEKGRRLLMSVARRHGLESWKTYRVQEIVAQDFWVNANLGWWADANQKFFSQSILGTFTSRVELLDGSEKGKILGIHSWNGYLQETSDSKVVSSNEGRILFYLPTLQYFHELPFRLISAPLVSYAGQASHEGRSYDLIFVSWGSWEANETYDQYVLWIDSETRQIRMAHYTIRETLPSASGTIHFTDYREVQGIQVAFEHTVIVGGPSNTRYPLKEHYFHRLKMESVSFRPDVPDELSPLKGVLEAGDRKPTK